MSNNDWVKLHKEMDITNRLVYWAQNEDMIDQYYTQRGQDLLEAEAEIIKLRLMIDKCIEVCYNMPDDTDIDEHGHITGYDGYRKACLKKLMETE